MMWAQASSRSDPSAGGGLSWLIADLPVSLVLADPRGSPPPLLPEEECLIAGAAPERRAEFAHGRAAARRAVAALGLPSVPILAGMDRAPLWPQGLVGSISHCSTLCGAVVGHSGALQSIGLDMEALAPLPLPASAICSSEEEEAFHRWPPPCGTDWAMIAFLAKEAFYKCQYPVTRRFLEFRDGRITLDRPQPQWPGGGFSIDLDDRRAGRIAGRWLITNGHIMALAMTI